MRLFLAAYRQHIWILLFFALIALIPLVPMASNLYIPNEKDFYNHVAMIIQAKLAWAEGQFPLRIAPLEQTGWRYPFFQFYSPTSYSFTALIYKWITPQNPFIAYKITLWCALLAGGIYMRRLALWFTQSRAAALLAGVVYLTAPYCFIVLSRVGGFNEGIALGLLPVVIYYTLKRYYAENENVTLIQAAFVWYLLLTVHAVTFLYTSLLVAVFVLFLGMKTQVQRQRLMQVGTAYGLGCLMGMWFLAPILLLEKYFVVALTFADVTSFYKDFSPNFLSLISPMANFIIKFDNVVGTVRPSIGLPICMGIVISIYAFFHKNENPTGRLNEWLLPLMGVFLVALLLAWSPFNFWQWLPDQLRAGQYSWRILSQVTWIGALLFASALCWVFKDELDHRHVVVGLFLIIMASSSWLTMIDRPLFPVANIIEKPLQVFAEGSYLINTQRNTQFIEIVDNVLLDTLMPEHNLKFDFAYYISPKLLGYAVAPILLMKGNALPAVAKGKNKLIALINNKAIGEWQLKPGKFEWKIDLKKLANLKSTGLLALQFKKQGPFFANQNAKIAIETISLTGFLKPNETLAVKQVEPFCKQVKGQTVCQLNVPANVKLVELPILYYPHLSTLTLNGHTIIPQGVLHRYHAIMGIVPEAGKMNVIKVRFTGLEWANRVSMFAWALWGIVWLMIGLQKRPKPQIG